MLELNSLGMVSVDLLIRLHKMVFGQHSAEADPSGHVFLLHYSDRKVGIFLDAGIPNEQGNPTHMEIVENSNVGAAFVRPLDGRPLAKLGQHHINYGYMLRSDGLLRRSEEHVVEVMKVLGQRIIRKEHDADWAYRALQLPVLSILAHEIRHELQVSGQVPKLRTPDDTRSIPNLHMIARESWKDRLQKPSFRASDAPLECDATVTEVWVGFVWMSPFFRNRRKRWEEVRKVLVG